MEIDQAKVKSRSEADKMLEKVEPVSFPLFVFPIVLSILPVLLLSASN